MSTKIYDAYRIKKDKVDNIYDLLHEFREVAKEYVSQNEKLLRRIHVGSFYYHMMNTDDGERLIKRYKDAKFIDWEIADYLRYSENTLTREIVAIDVKVLVTLFMDDEYWYMKFFINDQSLSKVLRILEDKYDYLEDYHYQNQTDPPEDIPYQEFKKRGEVWDKLTERSGGTYRDGLQYELFDSYEFMNLLRKNFYTGTDDLFSHLAYKFPPLDMEKKNDNSKDN